MDGILEVYRKMGGQYDILGGKLIVNGKTRVSPLKLLETEVYPGFTYGSAVTGYGSACHDTWREQDPGENI